MADFFDDPSHPDRPQHLDFWRLIDAVNDVDGQQSEGGKQLPDILDGLVDVESAIYLARQRSLRIQQLLGLDDPRLASALGAVWLDGMTAGIKFERSGGHRDSPNP